jgi:hypothetical protein
LARRKNRVLVLGNGPQINDIDFGRLDQDIITIGVNRIWVKHYPDFFFFHDYGILHELNRDENEISKIKLTQSSHCYSSEWIKKTILGPVPSWLRVHPMSDRSAFPDSVSNAVRIFRDNHIRHSPSSDYQFYFAGVNLRWTDPSHFWKSENHNFTNKHDRKWYDVRFDRTYGNFEKMKRLDYKMISVTPGSRLNKLMRYESIGNLYSKS